MQSTPKIVLARIPRTRLPQLSGHHMAQSSGHTKLTFTLVLCMPMCLSVRMCGEFSGQSWLRLSSSFSDTYNCGWFLKGTKTGSVTTFSQCGELAMLLPLSVYCHRDLRGKRMTAAGGRKNKTAMSASDSSDAMCAGLWSRLATQWYVVLFGFFFFLIGLIHGNNKGKNGALIAEKSIPSILVLTVGGSSTLNCNSVPTWADAEIWRDNLPPRTLAGWLLQLQLWKGLNGLN